MSETDLTSAVADALSGTTDPGTDLTYPAIGESTYYTTMYRLIHRLLAMAGTPGNELRAYKDGEMTFGVRPGRLALGTTMVAYAGCTGEGLTNNATNYVYLTVADLLAGDSVTVSTAGFPTDGTLHVPLATIVTSAGAFDHADITDHRGRAVLAPIRDGLKTLAIPLTDLRRTGDLSALPTAGDGTDLGLAAGTHGTASSRLASTAVGAGASGTEKARFLVALPPDYIDGRTVTLRLHARAADTAATSATVDVEAYAPDGEGGVGADLCATAAQNVNGDTDWADVDFTITATNLAAGDVLDVEITVAINDSGGGGDGAQVEIGAVEILLDAIG